MDTKQRLQKCFETLGFPFPFPCSLHVNPSTNFIWQQIIDITPKNEKEVVRKNRMISRMENKSSKDVIQCPVPEIEIYNQLKTVREQISDKKARILEKQNKHCSLHSSNNANYWIINDVKQKNTEKKIKFHATQMTCRHFKDEIKDIQASLDNREISPNPVETSISLDLINEHLQHIVTQTEEWSYIRSNCNQLDCTSSCQKRIFSIEKSPSQSNFSILKNINQRVTGIQRFVSYTNLPTAKVLFADSHKAENMSMTNCNDLYEFDISGGLLPETCFIFKADDEFLLSSQANFQQKSERSDLNVNSKEFKTERSDTNTSRQCNLQLEDNDKLERDSFNRASSDNNIIKFIEKILYNNNRELIWGSFCCLRKKILSELKQNMEHIRNRSDICTGELLPLNFIYMKNNLLCLKSEKQIKIMNNALRENKTEIQKKLNNLEKNTVKTLKHMEIIKLEGAVNFILKEVFNTNTKEHQTTLEILKTEISKFKNEMQTQVEEIVDYFVKKDDIMKKTKTCQDETSLVVSKLNKFLFNFSWAHALSGNMKLNEMETFQKYPLEYAKQFCFIDDGTFFRESLNDLSLDVIAPNDIMYELMSLLHPLDPLEKKIAEILIKMDKIQMKSFKNPDLTIQEGVYSLQQLKEKEKYIDTFCGNLNTSMHSNKVHHILKSSTYMRLNMELWLDMPFRNFVSSERIIEDKKYKEYQGALEDFGKLK